MRSMRSKVLVRIAFVGLFVLIAAGCGSNPQPKSTPASGVQGRAMTSGGELDAGPNPRPMPNVAIFVHEGDLHGTIVAQTKADSTGAFKIDLPPGTYTLVEGLYAGGVPKTITVKPGAYVRVRLMIVIR
jgi:hypothetical protein